jgi:hypothetical protein
MSSNLKYAAALKNARLNQITTEISTSGLLSIYSGTQPTNPDTALSGNTLLAQLALSSTFAPGASGGVLTANAISTETSANATGTAVWFSLTTSGGTRMIDGTVGTSGADMTINTTSIVSGAAVSCSSLTITSGN